MLTFEQAQEALTKLADELPAEIYNGLNGGIILLPDTVFHPDNLDGSLMILGQYRYEPTGFGRYIAIFYGSFQRVYGGLPKERQIGKLKDVLRHELVHHLESMAGDRSLERKDAEELEQYRRSPPCSGKEI